MNSQEICPSCRGTGEGVYLRPIPYSQETSDSIEPCRSCNGTGFEQYPTLKDLKASRSSLEASIEAMDRAIEALDRVFNESR